jgi:hypothetical protein
MDPKKHAFAEATVAWVLVLGASERRVPSHAPVSQIYPHTPNPRLEDGLRSADDPHLADERVRAT